MTFCPRDHLRILGSFVLIASTPYLASSQITNDSPIRLVNGINGKPLGLTYDIIGDGIPAARGELARHTDEGIFLFVSCGSPSYVRAGDTFMRRHKRNCNNDLSIWPASLVSFVDTETTFVVAAPPREPITGQSERTLVKLTGPPEHCGFCRPIPYVRFALPPGVEVISEDAVTSLIEAVVEETVRWTFPTRTEPPIFLDTGLRAYGGSWRFLSGTLTQMDTLSREAIALWDTTTLWGAQVPERTEYRFTIGQIDPGEDRSGSLFVRLPAFNFGIAWDPRFDGPGVRGELRWMPTGMGERVRHFELPSGLASYIEDGIAGREPFDIRLRLDSNKGDVYFKDPGDEDTWWTVVSDQEVIRNSYDQFEHVGLGTRSMSAGFEGFSVGGNW